MANTAVAIARTDPMLMRSERGADMALTALFRRFRTAQCWQFPRGHRPIVQARFGHFETMPAKPAPGGL